MNRNTAVGERSVGKPNSIVAVSFCRLRAFSLSVPGLGSKFQNSTILQFHNSNLPRLKSRFELVYQLLVNKIVLDSL